MRPGAQGTSAVSPLMMTSSSFQGTDTRIVLGQLHPGFTALSDDLPFKGLLAGEPRKQRERLESLVRLSSRAAPANTSPCDRTVPAR